MITTISNNTITDLMRNEKDINRLKIRIVKAINAGADINANNDMGLTPLTYAETVEQTKLLIELGADVNVKSDVMEWTPLMLAKTAEQAKLLVNAGADINARNMCCENALMLAANEDIAQFLIDSGSEVNNSTLLGYVLANSEPNKKIIDILLQNGADKKVLDMAFIQSTRAKQINTLLELGVNVNTKNGNGKTALMYQQCAETAKILLNYGINVNAQDNMGKTALMHIFEQFSLIRTVLKPEKFKDIEETKYRMSDFSKLTKLLIDYGADVNIRDNNGNTALMYALCAKDSIGKQNNAHINLVKEEYSRQIKLLIQVGVDVNAQNYDGRTALMLSQDKNKMKSLLKAEPNITYDDYVLGISTMFADYRDMKHTDKFSNINVQNYQGQTALMLAYDEEETRILIEAGANVNLKDDLGKTALMYAENAEQTKLLLDAGADVNAKDDLGFTALMFAQTSEQIDLLLNAGADITARDYAIGYTALIWTLLDKFTTEDIKRQKIAVLLKAGANINEQNNNGYTALMYADNVEQTRLLLEFGADVNIKDNNGLTVLDHDQNKNQLELLAQAGLIG